MEGEKNITNVDVFKELKRRVDITRRSRINAAARLRDKHEFYEKLSFFYSLLVLILSIWYMTGAGLIMTKVLLVASLSLTFFSMFLNIRNYKERASNVESNYQQLNVLLNKMQRLEANLDGLSEIKIKELHRDYEKLIVGQENHERIDYIKSTRELSKQHETEILKHNIKMKLVSFLYASVPLVLLIVAIIITKS